MYHRLTIFCCIFCFHFAVAQQGSGVISGKIFGMDQEAIPGVTILIKGSNSGAYSDASGNYRLEKIPYGYHTLVFTVVGHEKLEKTVEISGPKEISLSVELQESTTSLEEIQIIGKSEVSEIKELPYAVTALDVRPMKAQNLDVNQILNMTSGVRIREEGGLGSNFNFSLNGFSGNQVKFFMDGVPMDNFGSSLTLNNIPVNLISRVEVYKGVVPVHLGADALGGAINVLTNQSMKSYLDVSYSFGSFNTHRAAIIGRFANEKNGLVVNANAFYNYSDNNYIIDVQVPDPNTGAYGDPEKIERFHDAYQSQTVQLEAGVTDKKYADKLIIGVIASGNRKEVQTGSNMTRVAGEVYRTDQVFIPTFKYQLSDIFTEGLSASVYATYNFREAMVVDTSSRVYDWHGNYTVRNIDVRAGELNWDKTLFRFNDHSSLATMNLSYEISPSQSIAFNNTFSRYTRVGEDPISYTAVPFSEPNTLTKNITGLSYQFSLFDDRWKTTAFGKLFMMDALTKEGEGIATDKNLTDISASEVNGGFGLASTYFITKGIQIKASYENTYRMPEAYEMFGDGLLLLSSPRLKPEKSQNYNVGLLAKHIWRQHEFLVEAGYLYRLPTNLIRRVGLGVTSTFENLSSAKANIVEGGMKYSYDRKLNLEGNISYQNIVNNEKYTPTGGENYLYGDRIPNVPFLFANGTAGINLDHVGAEQNSLAFNWTVQFVEAFYLKWPSQGDPNRKYDIPRQVSHNLGISYSIQDGKYNASFSCTNIFDKALYDDFRLQKPGRSFNLKLRYFLFQKNN